MFVFEWDESKERSNFRKHEVRFAEGKSVFFDTFSITIADPYHSLEENRFIDIGMSDKNRILVIVYTERGERIRIISVRKATKAEQKLYEQD